MAFRAEWLVPHLLVILASILMSVAAWKRPVLARALYVALFAWAAAFNLSTALRTPEAYLAYAKLTDSPTYRAIIEGPFARHAAAYVVAIAIGQAAIAVGLSLRGALVKAAALGAIVFLVAIAPLGVGSAFPSTLLLAGGAYLLGRRTFERSLVGDAAAAFARLRPRHG